MTALFLTWAMSKSRLKGINKDMRAVIAEALKNGWNIHKGKNHLKLTRDGYQTIFCAVTPGCPHAHKNLKSMIKRVERGEKAF